MEIEFSLTAQDIIKVMKQQKKLIKRAFKTVSSFSIWLNLLFWIFLILWPVPTVIFVANLPDGMGLWLLYIIIIPLVYMIFFVLRYKRMVNKLISIEISHDTKRTVSLNDYGIESTVNQSRSSISWDRIKNIIEVPDYIMFVLPLFSCIAIPTRFFDNKDQLAEFISNAHIKMTNATALNKAMKRIDENTELNGTDRVE